MSHTHHLESCVVDRGKGKIDFGLFYFLFIIFMCRGCVQCNSRAFGTPKFRIPSTFENSQIIVKLTSIVLLETNKKQDQWKSINQS